MPFPGVVQQFAMLTYRRQSDQYSGWIDGLSGSVKRKSSKCGGGFINLVLIFDAWKPPQGISTACKGFCEIETVSEEPPTWLAKENLFTNAVTNGTGQRPWQSQMESIVIEIRYSAEVVIKNIYWTTIKMVSGAKWNDIRTS